MKLPRIHSLAAAALLASAGAADAQLVFSRDFNSSAHAAVNASTALLTDVQGYASPGPRRRKSC